MIKDMFDQDIQVGDYLVGTATHDMVAGILIGLTKVAKRPSVICGPAGSKVPIRGEFLRINPEVIPGKKFRELEEGFKVACEKYKIRIDENERRQRLRG